MNASPCRLRFPDSLDFLKLDQKLSDSQRQLRGQVRGWLEQHIFPIINEHWEHAEFPLEVARAIRELPIVGGILQSYDNAALDQTSLGLVVHELARCDGSITTFFSVHSGLAMGTIGTLGSDEQKARWLPAMARLEKIGAFSLTEPARGSNAAHVQTVAEKDGNYYLLNGKKRWIGNASIADVLIVWARDNNNQFCAFVVEDPQHTEGVHIEKLEGKIAKRAVVNGEITLTNVRVPLENRLERVTSFRDAAHVLVQGRYVVAWEAAGAAAGALDYALKYARESQQSGTSIASFQLIQQKLVEMATDVSLMQLTCLRLATLMTTGQASDGMIAMAKYNNARKARVVTQLAREIMGGDGLLIEHHVARLWTDAEAMYTYEGTNEIATLLVGRELTGINAFI